MSRSILFVKKGNVEKKFYYGGQAVVEGVMMRGQKTMITAVRHPDGGIAIDIQLLTGSYAGRMRKLPFIRGIFILVETLVLGMKALIYSAKISLNEEEQEKEMSRGLIWSIAVAGMVFGITFFFLVPLFLTRLLNINSPVLFNLIDGLIRVAIFIIYLKLITLVPDIKRVFAYHGAEHKAVNAYENAAPLQLGVASKYSTAHVRCSTSFIFVVLTISILVFAIVGLHTVWIMVLSRIVLIPVIAAISYEVIYFGARHVNNSLVRGLLTPGLWLQALTTREPDDSQLEVALVALKKAVEADQTEGALTPS